MVTERQRDDPPSFSVVIPTHDREEYFLEAYRSVLRARDNYDGEVTVLAVTSADDPFIESPAEGVTEIHVPDKPGASPKRNVGIEAAEGDWVVFVDDDTVVAEDAFATVADCITDDDCPDAAGFYPITEFEGEKSRAFRACEDTPLVRPFQFARETRDVPYGTLTFAAFERAALEDVGGFDESFAAGAGGEDVDIAVRLTDAGYDLYGIPETLVRHTTATWNSFRGNLRRFYAYGIGDTDLTRKHPDRRKLKLNAPPFVAMVLLVASLAVGRVHGPALGLSLVPLYLVASQVVTLASYRMSMWKPLDETVLLRLYFLAYQFGIVVNALERGRPDLTAFRFRHEPSADGHPEPLGRRMLITFEEIPQVAATAFVACYLVVALSV